jgi:hypothetical protein
MTLSNYLENALGNAVLRNTTYTSPATVYLHLYPTDPTEADTATELTTAGGYAPQSIAFSAPTNGVFPNSGAVNFPTGATLSSAAFSGAAAFMGIRDSVTPNAGNLLWYGRSLQRAAARQSRSPAMVRAGWRRMALRRLQGPTSKSLSRLATFRRACSSSAVVKVVYDQGAKAYSGRRVDCSRALASWSGPR